MVTKQFCGCFQFIWIWLLIGIMKRDAERMCAPYFFFFSAAELNNIDSEDEVFAKEFSCQE